MTVAVAIGSINLRQRLRRPDRIQLSRARQNTFGGKDVTVKTVAFRSDIAVL